MGYRISWLAAKGLSSNALLDHFDFRSTDERDEANEAPFSTAELPTGWTILWSNDPTFANVERCQRLSEKAPIVSCWVNETVMLSSANYFEGGNYLWFVGHNAQEGQYDLQSDGSLPPQFDAIKERLTHQQDQGGGDKADVDFIFDIPLELAHSICGFKHDMWKFEWGEPEFFIAEQRIGWFRKLFKK